MSILLVSQVFPPMTGGSGRWLWELYHRLDMDVHVAAGAVAGAETFDRTAQIPISRVPLKLANWGLWHPRSAWQYLHAFRLLNRVVARVRPGVVHAGKCLPEGLLAMMVSRRLSLPFWCYVHGEELTLAATSRELARLSARVLARAAMVVANSEHTKRMLLERWQLDGRRVAVMHPGVDTSRFKPAPLDDNIRAKSGWRDRRVLLTVGALQKRKGQDMLIRALPAIRARCPDVLYAIIGEGWERPYLERLAADSGVADVVQFRGAPSDDELIACYQQCDLFVLPNRQVGWDFEGFGIALIEAQACGKPVVTGVSGGTRETLDVSRTGELVACETPGAVATAVADLLDDSARRARMGAAARTWAVERFDWAVLTREAQELFAPDGACK